MIKCACNNQKCRIVLHVDDHDLVMTNRYGPVYDQRLQLNEENIKHLILELQNELKSIRKKKDHK